MEFSANVGKLNIKQLTTGHCPLIVELKGGKKGVLKLTQKSSMYFLTKKMKKNTNPTHIKNLKDFCLMVSY